MGGVLFTRRRHQCPNVDVRNCRERKPGCRRKRRKLLERCLYSRGQKMGSGAKGLALAGHRRGLSTVQRWKTVEADRQVIGEPVDSSLGCFTFLPEAGTGPSAERGDRVAL